MVAWYVALGEWGSNLSYYNRLRSRETTANRNRYYFKDHPYLPNSVGDSQNFPKIMKNSK